MALEYTFMWFGVEMFAQRVLKWLVVQCRMLSSELLDLFIAFLVPYTWVLCLFICFFSNVRPMFVVLNPSKSWQSQWLLWVYVTQVGLSGHQLKLHLQKKCWVISTDHQHTCLPK